MRKKWILIADGERAKIIEKSADGLKNIGLTYHSQASDKDKGHHSPGRVNPSVSHAQHSFPPHEEFGAFEKHEFAKKMADILNHNANHFDELLLIAPPKVLGDLRMGLTPTTIAKIFGEVHKDYIHTPISEIEHLF